MITVVDYGVGNIGAILNMLDFLGIDSQSSGDPEVLVQADKLLLPGVGAFDAAMRTLNERQLVQPLSHAVLERKVPVMGVCLGMQLLARRSEEGQLPGLGWVEADVRRIRLPAGSALKVPHIGWSDVRPTRHDGLFPAEASGERFYFDHSYVMECVHAQDVAAVIDYDGERCCAVMAGHVWGVQFHPEKSHRFGMRLLRTFAEA